jgi:hypothetical protein
MRVKILTRMKGDVEGIDLTRFEVGKVYNVRTFLANYLLASGYAEPVTNHRPRVDDVSERSRGPDLEKGPEIKPPRRR